MLSDPALRTLYRLADRVDGHDLVRVQEEIARRRSRLEVADQSESPLAPVADTADSGPKPLPARRFRPLGRDEVPRLIRRPGERKNRVAPPAAG